MKNFRFSFGFKIGMALSSLSMLISAAGIAFLYNYTYRALIEQVAKKTVEIGQTSAYLFQEEEREDIKFLKSISESRMQSLTEFDLSIEPGETKPSIPDDISEEIMKGDEFQKIVQLLRSIKAASMDHVQPLGFLQQITPEKPAKFRYVYMLAEIPQMPSRKVLKFIADADYEAIDENGDGKISEEEKAVPIGTLYSVNSREMINAFDGNSYYSREIYSDKWGKFIGSMVPIKDTDGKVLAILCMEYEVSEVLKQTKQILYISGGIIFASFLLSLLFSTIVAYWIAKPINALKDAAEKVSNQNYNVSITTDRQDEIGVLSRTFGSMVREIQEFTRKLEESNMHLQRLNQSYKRFVPQEFLGFLKKKSITDVDLGDHIQKEMTVFFCDIRSFTELSEKMSPRDNFQFLNSYLKRVGPVIRNNGGFIDKYIGDAIMALFSDADSALTASVQLLHEIQEYNYFRHKSNYEPIEVGIGLHTGNLIMGTIGESERMEGTVISDSVNLASRIEGLTKYFGASLLISGETFRLVRHKEKFHYRIVDTVKVKGKSASVQVVEIFDGLPEEKAALYIKTKEAFEKAVAEYQNREFSKCIIEFQKILEINSSDKASQIYLNRAKHFLEFGVPDEWSGIESMTEK